jgi:hypothetical protein
MCLAQVLAIITEFRNGWKELLASSDTPAVPSTHGADIVFLCRNFARAYKAAEDAEKQKLEEEVQIAAQWLLKQVLPLVTAGNQPGVTKYGQPELPYPAVITLATYLSTLSDATGRLGAGLRSAHTLAEHVLHRMQLASSSEESGLQQLDTFAWAQLLHGLMKAGLVPSATRDDDEEEQGGIGSTSSSTYVHPSRLSPALQKLVELSAQQTPGTLSSQGCDARSLSLLLIVYARAKYTGDLTAVTQVRRFQQQLCM